MTVEVIAADSVSRPTVEQVATDRLWVVAQCYFFETQEAAFEVHYGNASDPGIVLKTEIWIASGPPLVSFMSEAPVGDKRFQVLQDIAKDLVESIQTSPNLKQNLIDQGNLRVRPGTLRGYIG